MYDDDVMKRIAILVEKVLALELASATQPKCDSRYKQRGTNKATNYASDNDTRVDGSPCRTEGVVGCYCW